MLPGRFWREGTKEKPGQQPEGTKGGTTPRAHLTLGKGFSNPLSGAVRPSTPRKVRKPPVLPPILTPDREFLEAGISVCPSAAPSPA